MPPRAILGEEIDPLDALRAYPTAWRYLAQQPAGWDSHPQCLASSQLFRSLRRSGALDGLEDVVRCVRDDGSGWISEVAVMAILLTLRDVRFGGTANADEGFLAWMDAINRPLVVRAETKGSPSDAPECIREVWDGLHRGTAFEVRARREDGATMTLRHPRALWPDCVHEWRRRAFLASLASHGAVRPRAAVRNVEEGTDYELGW